jgi:hypothetical protein
VRGVRRACGGMEGRRRGRRGGGGLPALTAGAVQRLLALRASFEARPDSSDVDEVPTGDLTLQVLEVLEAHTHGCGLRVVRLFDGAEALTACVYVRNGADVAPLQLLAVQHMSCVDVNFRGCGAWAPAALRAPRAAQA